jgi:hypothetical protein
MEPERKIEEWLRAYAKKRRGQAGDSFKLDPVGRSFLQGEVSRSGLPAEDDDETLSLWEVLRRNWIYLLGFAACIFVLASFFFQTVNTAKNSRLAASEALKAAAKKQEVAPAPATRTVAMSPTPAGARDITAPTPPAELPRVSAASTDAALKLDASRQFQKIQNGFINTSRSPIPGNPVLRNFDVSQDGNSIRVVDQDGSVYTGTLEPEMNTVNAVPGSRPTPNESHAQNAGAPKAVSPNAPDLQNYSFRVGGINRTLKQSVVFTATLLDDLSTMKDAQLTFGMKANAAVGAGYAQQLMKSKQTNQVQLPWSTVRISGMAFINGTNLIQINAMPTTSAKSRSPAD